jgi:hypothetical protein
MRSRSVCTAKYIALIILIILCWSEQFNSYVMDFLDQTLVQSLFLYCSRLKSVLV